MVSMLDRVLYGKRTPEGWESPRISDLRSLPAPRVVEGKAAYDIIPTGVQGRPQYPDTDIASLQGAYSRNEIVYAAINRKASSAVDPRLMVQQKKGGDEWAEVEGHPFRRLHMRPNEYMDESDFMRCYIVSQDTSGIFYAEIVRGANQLPTELHPLNPAKTTAIPGSGPRSVNGVAEYEYKDGNNKVRIPARDVLVKRKYNPTNRYYGLSPLAVCMGAVDADSAQTDYVRAFFNNAGVPSGLITVKGRTLSQPESDQIRSQFRAKYGRMWGNQHDVAVMDENATYQKIGANLNELQSQQIRSFTESRVTMVFEVPPLIIYAYVGLMRATYSNLKEAWAGFWDATLTPLFKEYRTWLTWTLLTEFVSEDLIYGERIRLNWDMSQVAWLQDDVDAMQARARENFKAGGITLNEFREAIGEAPDEAGDYYLRPAHTQAVELGMTSEDMNALGAPAPAAATPPATDSVVGDGGGGTTPNTDNSQLLPPTGDAGTGQTAGDKSLLPLATPLPGKALLYSRDGARIETDALTFTSNGHSDGGA